MILFIKEDFFGSLNIVLNASVESTNYKLSIDLFRMSIQSLEVFYEFLKNGITM